MENYTRWKWHGECSYAGRHCLSEGSETVERIPDLGGNEDVGVLSDEDHEISLDSNKFMQFVEDGDKPLYPGYTKSTKMNGLVQTFNLKAKHGLSDSCYTDILILFHTLLPDGNEVPGSVNLAKKTLSALGMKYEKIDACPNDCIMYRDLNVDAKKCPSCNASRWKLAKDGSEKVGCRRRHYGCVVKGYNACPICVEQTKPYRLKHSKKLVYLRNRRQLPRHHPYRKQASAFDNTVEKDDAPTPLTREETFARVQDLPKASGKGNTPAPYKGPLENRPCWKKKSVFYDLDYWKFFPVRHNLDVMHIEKNCCDAIFGTLLNISGKTKDGVASRLDMVDMGICTDLKPIAGVKRDKLPLASWNLFVDERKIWMYPFERYMKVFKGMVHNRTFPEGCIAECYIVEEAVEFLEERMLPEDATTVGIPKSSRPGQLNGCKRLSALKSSRLMGNYWILLIYVYCRTVKMCNHISSKEHMEFLELSFPYNINNPKWMKDKQNQTFPDWFKKRVANEIRITDNEVPETIRWLARGPNKEVPTFHGYHVNGVDFNTMERDSKRSVQNSGVFLVANAMQIPSAKDKRPTTVDMDFYGRIQQIWEVDYYKFRVPIFLCDWVESSRGVKVDELGYTLVKLDRIWHLNDPFVLATHLKQIVYIEDPLDVEWSVVVRGPDKDLKGGGGDDDDDEVAAADDDYYDEDDNIVVEQHPYIPIMPPVESFDNVVGDEPSSYARLGDEGTWVDK
ncbi:hypothetical protein ACLB2K_047019 [Fragaria x ananassa]